MFFPHLLLVLIERLQLYRTQRRPSGVQPQCVRNCTSTVVQIHECLGIDLICSLGGLGLLIRPNAESDIISGNNKDGFQECVLYCMSPKVYIMKSIYFCFQQNNYEPQY